MTRYQNFLNLIQTNGIACNLTHVTIDQIHELRGQYPGVPEDYLDFLLEVGCGSFAGGVYWVYSGLVTSDDIFDPEIADRLPGLLFFGDDFQGFCGGFYPEKHRSIIEVDSTNFSVSMVASSFELFIIGAIRSKLVNEPFAVPHHRLTNSSDFATTSKAARGRAIRRTLARSVASRSLSVNSPLSLWGMVAALLTLMAAPFSRR